MTTTAPSAAGGAPRLTLEPTASRDTLLDGAWWPRSDDLLTALPALVLALHDRRGPVTHPMLGAGMSAARPTRLAVARATAADACNALHAPDILSRVAPGAAPGEPHHRQTTKRPAS